MNGWTNHKTWQYWTIMNNTESVYMASMKMRAESKNIEELGKKLAALGGDDQINFLEIAEALWESK